MDIHKVFKTTFHRLILLLLLSFTALVVNAESYPAHCRVTTTLNVRSGPGTGYSKIGKLYKNNQITVNSVTTNGSRQWGTIDYKGRTGYVAVQYVHYLNPVQEEPSNTSTSVVNKRSSSRSLWGGVWDVLVKIFIGIIVIICLTHFSDILQFIITTAVYAGIGAFITYILFGNANIGACIGGSFMPLTFLWAIIQNVGSNYGSVFVIIYNIISFPFYFLNRLEHFLLSPWRYFFMTNWVSDSIKPALRVVTNVITVIMFIVTTPLRLLNAIIYNIFIHCVTGIYDLFLEVLFPSDDGEGGADVWTWIYMLPYRVLYYTLWHFVLLLLESMIWTVVDIFIPALTFYHGTTLNAGDIIIRDPNRNKYLKNTSNWSSGNFMASSDPNRTWAGRGVYFAIQRGLAMAYSDDNRSGRGGDPVMIACRVSMGWVISYALMPDRVYNQTGGGGNHDEINKFADAHGYTMGEWRNPRGVWEYCLFDWQKGYNYPWRIRPIYMINIRTGLAQHISGGMQHWLFNKMVLQDILNSPRFIGLLIFAVLVVLWFVFYGWNYVWNEYLSHYFL